MELMVDFLIGDFALIEKPEITKSISLSNSLLQQPRISLPYSSRGRFYLLNQEDIFQYLT